MTDHATLQELAKRHLMMHFTSQGRYSSEEVPVISRGEGCWLWDTNGKRYFDGMSGLFCTQIGHSFGAELGEAAAKQMAELPFYTNWNYAHPRSVELAGKVAELAPGDLNRIFFVSGGSEANEAIKDIRRVKGEVADREGKLTGAQQTQFKAIATSFVGGIGEVEDSVYQTKNRSGQDPLNYPIRLNNRIGALLGVVQSSDGRPTQQSYDVYKLLSSELTRDMTKLQKLMNTELPKLNAILKAAGLKEIEPAKGPVM